MNINELPKGWTKRQYKFALNYLIDPNATEAARKAGYSEKTAKSIGNQNLTKLHISKFIAEESKKAIAPYEAKVENTLRELAKVAYSNMLDYVVINPETGLPVINMRKVTRDQWSAISKLKVRLIKPMAIVENGEEISIDVIEVELALWDKNRALDTLGKYIGLEKALEVNHNHSGEVKVKYSDEDLARRLAFVLARGAKKIEHRKTIDQAVVKDSEVMVS